MKRSFTLATTGLLVLATSMAMMPNYSVKRTGTLNRGSHFVFPTSDLMTAPRADIRGFANLIGQVCNDVRPVLYTSTRSADLTAGYGNNSYGYNSQCDVTYGRITAPNGVAVTEDYSSGGYVGEFDVTISSSNGLTYGDGYGNFMDRKTVLRREFAHGIGLGDSRSPSTLMYKGLTTNQVKSVDQDAQDGFRCIYDNACGGNECGSGAVEVVQGQGMRDSRTALTWSVSESRQDIKGFNVYRKRGSTYEAINPTLIKALAGAPDYAFALPQGQSFKDGTYFLEVLLTRHKGSASFTVFKS